MQWKMFLTLYRVRDCFRTLFISVCRKDSASRRRHNIIFSRKHLQVTYFSNTFGDELREGKPYKGQHVQ
ncbi:hypothetical protein HMPREF9441_00007 [Paraprevotella clara YIT 11840]|uniref:Uncharacterized protein n=1 Tax=Paraprevotella clara YIT 11840 TaxID=762968 RepID=G5SKZ0_9BACT|nr:hypothetical protein HMPREF9441_00007 [Paraprevotella clara YIT 11840]